MWFIWPNPKQTLTPRDPGHWPLLHCGSRSLGAWVLSWHRPDQPVPSRLTPVRSHLVSSACPRTGQLGRRRSAGSGGGQVAGCFISPGGGGLLWSKRSSIKAHYRPSLMMCSNFWGMDLLPVSWHGRPEVGQRDCSCNNGKWAEVRKLHGPHKHGDMWFAELESWSWRLQGQRKSYESSKNWGPFTVKEETAHGRF